LTNYETQIEKATQTGLKVVEKTLKSNAKGLCKGNIIALNTEKLRTGAEKACVLSEEMGHAYTTVGNITDQTVVGNRKQERRARVWAYNDKVGLTGLIRAYEQGCHTRLEAAEYLDVTEAFLEDAVYYYREKYGKYVQLDNYFIQFVPCLGVAKMF